LLVSYLAIVLIRDYVLKVNLRQRTGLWFMCFQLLLAFVICIMAKHFFSQVPVFILIGEFALHQKRKISVLFTTISYTACLFSIWIFRGYPEFVEIYYFFPRFIDFFAILGICELAKIALQQKNQLAKDNEQLRIASMELGRKAKLQERTRISRDIHDSVGHTLTSALTGLQTAAFAIEKNNVPLAVDMIERTRENILSGLDDVRTSVHLLRENVPGHQLIPELIELIEDTVKQTNIDIDYTIDPEWPELSPMIEITLFRALQEGLTNGIRHGASTSFDFSLTYDNKSIRFVLSDNGTPPQQIVYGFGLNAMKERVEDVGGTMSISLKEGASGIQLEIMIPIQSK
jgi:signal transduction histidine kinase